MVPSDTMQACSQEGHFQISSASLVVKSNPRSSVHVILKGHITLIESLLC